MTMPNKILAVEEPNAVHWRFRAGAEETMCGLESSSVPTTLLADRATCRACNAAFGGYNLGRAGLPQTQGIDVRNEIVRRIVIARAEKLKAENSGYDRDVLRLDGAVGTLENLLEDIDILNTPDK